MTINKIIECLHESTTASLAETPDKKFPLNCGVKQGGIESPMLYNLFIDFVMMVFMNRYKEFNINFLKMKYKLPVSESKQVGRLAQT